MTDLPVKGYATYDRLKTCIVGRTYSKESFRDIKNQKVKDILSELNIPDLKIKKFLRLKIGD